MGSQSLRQAFYIWWVIFQNGDRPAQLSFPPRTRSQDQDGKRIAPRGGDEGSGHEGAGARVRQRAVDGGQVSASRDRTGDVQPDVVAPRRSGRLRAAKAKEEPEEVKPEEPEEEKPEQPETKDEPEEDPAPRPSLLQPRDPRQARVRKLQALLYPDAKVGQKRKHRAFSDVKWKEIEDAYMVDSTRLTFEPTPVPLPRAKAADLRRHLKWVLKASNDDVGFWGEENVKGLAKDVFTYAGAALRHDKVKIDFERTMDNEELGVNSRADIVVKKGGQELVVVECKRGNVNYGQGMAQMMLAAETLLSQKIKANNENCVYGLLAGCSMWTWMYLDDTEGRFHNSYIDPNHVQHSAEEMAAIAHGILRGKPITKSEEEASNSPGKRVKRN
jgi:hypothetical protein